MKKRKILVLGANKTEIEIINEAKKCGFYTIVTDNHTDWSLAPAKYVSDESWNVSWSDIDELYKLCFTNNVSGIMAGFSELRVVCAAKLAERLNLPFYAHNSKLDVITNKSLFKDACINANICVPASFSIDDDVKFPVIVKPNDNGGSRGISICYSRDELDVAFQRALEWSPTKSAVIEEYIIADETMVYFTVSEGKVFLSAICDRIMARLDKNITQLPVGYFYPSKYFEIFSKYNKEKFVSLIHNLNISNGLIAFQCFVRGNDFIPFDPTFRLDGTMAYQLTERINGIGSLKMLINCSMNGKMNDLDFIQSHENALFNKIAFQMPILLSAGRISRIEGLEKISNIEDVVYVYQGKTVGDFMEKKCDFSQMLCRIFIITDSMEKLFKDIDFVFSSIRVFDDNGKDMVAFRLPGKRIFSL